MEQINKDRQSYEAWVNDNFFMPLLKSRSGRYQLSKGIIHPTLEALSKHGLGERGGKQANNKAISVKINKVIVDVAGRNRES